jgi:plasmid replication initiation protein
MSKLFNTAIVQKRNILNELRSNNMSLQELRLFSIYLSKIDPQNISTRVVRFSLDDFRRIMGIGSDMNIAHFRYTIRHILQQIVEVPNENGSGYTAFQLFKKAIIEKDDHDEWYVEFNAHDDALPLMFDFKDKYLKYELWNALRLKSSNQVRMYEILKQYEKIGKRELTVIELRNLLGIKKNEYSGRTGWSDLKKCVLDSCQQALKETTDICYTYERGKVGRGGKWISIIFYITKNTKYVDQLTLEEFINQQPKPEPLAINMINEIEDDEEKWLNVYGSEQLSILAEGCNYEFNKEQMEQISRILLRIHVPKDELTNDLTYGKQFYLREKYAILNAEATKKERNGEKPINNRFKYFLKILESDTFQPAVYKNIIKTK